MNVFILVGLILSISSFEFGTCFVIKANETDPKSLIIGGYYIANHSVPYHVMLRCNGKFRCGGALVSAEHVVTAAHCLVIKKCNKLTVTAGTIYRKSGGLYIPADGWYIHPEFDYNSHHNDIAVIKLKYSFMVSESIAPIKLLTQPPRDGELVQVTGFGRIENESDRLSDIMKTYRSKLYDYEHCHQILKNNRVGPKDVCDRPIAGHGVCQGDSGSPLVNEGMQYLVGVVSRGYSCAKGHPNIYTSIYHHLPFIRNCLKA